MLLGLSACGQPSQPTSPPPPVAGERYLVKLQPVPELKPVAATVTSRDSAEARARIGGTLIRLLVKEGDPVRRGQVIAVVSDPRIGLQTRAYDAQLASAQAQSANAAAELSRTEDLYQRGVYAKARLDQVQASAKSAAGALEAARAQRAASAELGAQGAILAPADGRVLLAPVPTGSVVEPGQSIATLTAGPMVVRIEAPEADAAALKVGGGVQLTSDQPGQAAIRATITKVYPAVSGGKVVADLDAPGLASGPVGRRIALRLALGERLALVIPARFVMTRSGVDYARVLTPSGAADDVPIQTTPAGPGLIEVLSGLSAGDTLVPPGPAQ
jgi:RND family efflux transporter MFP subunit